MRLGHATCADGVLRWLWFEGFAVCERVEGSVKHDGCFPVARVSLSLPGLGSDKAECS
jgi:hypothetical protein